MRSAESHSINDHFVFPLSNSSNPNICFPEILEWSSKGKEKVELSKFFQIWTNYGFIKDTVFVSFSIFLPLRLDLGFSDSSLTLR